MYGKDCIAMQYSTAMRQSQINIIDGHMDQFSFMKRLKDAEANRRNCLKIYNLKSGQSIGPFFSKGNGFSFDNEKHVFEKTSELYEDFELYDSTNGHFKDRETINYNSKYFMYMIQDPKVNSDRASLLVTP